MVLFAGNTLDRTIITTLMVDIEIRGIYKLREYNSLLGHWIDQEPLPAEQLREGIVLQLERKGFWVIEVTQES